MCVLKKRYFSCNHLKRSSQTLLNKTKLVANAQVLFYYIFKQEAFLRALFIDDELNLSIVLVSNLQDDKCRKIYLQKYIFEELMI